MFLPPMINNKLIMKVIVSNSKKVLKIDKVPKNISLTFSLEDKTDIIDFDNLNKTKILFIKNYLVF